MTTSGSTPTTAPDPCLRVAVGVLRNTDGRVLVAERDAGRHAGGGLEFPGGKIEPGESVDDALGRELAEELGVGIDGSIPLMRVRHTYPERRVELLVRIADAWRGRPVGRERQALHWLAPSALDPAAFPAANRPIIAALRWPGRLRVTPAIAAADEVVPLAERIAAAAAAGDWIQVRQPDLAPSTWRDLVLAIRARTQAARTGYILLNTAVDDPLLTVAGFGLHLRADRARQLAGRPPGPPLLSCSAHDADELATAARLGADFAVVGPVAATPTHPAASGIDWPGLAERTATSALPIYAIGGLTPKDLETARDHGAVGVAGISHFWP